MAERSEDKWLNLTSTESIMKNLFLVVYDSDQSPIGIFDYATLCIEFNISRTEEELTMVYRWYREYYNETLINVIHIRGNRWLP